MKDEGWGVLEMLLPSSFILPSSSFPLEFPIAILRSCKFHVLQLRCDDPDLKIESRDLRAGRTIGKIHFPAMQVTANGYLWNDDLLVEKIVPCRRRKKPMNREGQIEAYVRSEIAFRYAGECKALR